MAKRRQNFQILFHKNVGLGMSPWEIIQTECLISVTSSAPPIVCLHLLECGAKNQMQGSSCSLSSAAHQNNLLRYLVHDLLANISPKLHYFTLLWHYCIIGLYLSYCPKYALASFCCITDTRSFLILSPCIWFLLFKCWFSSSVKWIYPADCGPWFPFVKTSLPFTVVALSSSLLLLINFCTHILSTIQALNYNLT